MLSGENPTPYMIPECLLKGAGGEYLCYDDLPSDAKAKALTITTQRLEIYQFYPNADFNDAQYAITNQVRSAGVSPKK
jgi:hypothetical protein